MCSRLAVFVISGLVGTAMLSETVSAQVNYFRHAHGLTGVNETDLPDQFGKLENLRWKTPLASGHSTPLIVGGMAIVTTFDPETERLSTIALDFDTGDRLWSSMAPVSPIEPHHRVGSPASATVATDGEHIFAFFGSYGMLSYDLAGNERWRRSMGPFQDEFGSGSSPIIVDNAVILNQDHDVDSFLIALDKRNGETLWKTPRPGAVRSYSTPTLYERDDRKEVLVAGALELSSYDAETGARNWWIDGLARIVIPIPVVGPDEIYVASWAPGGDSGARISMEPWGQAAAQWDKNGDGMIAQPELEPGAVLSRFYRIDLDQSQSLSQREWERHAAVFQNAKNAVFALTPKGRGDQTDSAIRWEYDRGVPYVATPLWHDGVLWMVKDGGIVTTINAKTGKLILQERLPALGNYYASPVIGDGKIYFASERGEVTVVSDDPDWDLISTYDFGSKIYATPVIQEGRILIRTQDALFSFGKN